MRLSGSANYQKGAQGRRPYLIFSFISSNFTRIG